VRVRCAVRNLQIEFLNPGLSKFKLIGENHD
jgi:hypothetical protein